jgi:hypothetical protein
MAPDNLVAHLEKSGMKKPEFAESIGMSGSQFRYVRSRAASLNRDACKDFRQAENAYLRALGGLQARTSTQFVREADEQKPIDGREEKVR